MRLTVKGVDKNIISFVLEKMPEEENEKYFLGWHVKQVIVKRKEQNSPSRRNHYASFMNFAGTFWTLFLYFA